MPGNTVTISGQTWELKPPVGLQAIKLVPKVINVLTGILGSADLAALVRGDFSFASDMGVMLLGTLSEGLLKQWDTVSVDIVPFLLNKDYTWLSNHGTPKEILDAIWTAVQFHAPYILGEETYAALKNSLSAVSAAAGSKMDSEQSEQ